MEGCPMKALLYDIATFLTFLLLFVGMWLALICF